MMYVYPKPTLEAGVAKYMSRLGIHMGTHTSAVWSSRSRFARRTVERIVSDVHLAIPVSTPSRVCNIVLGNLVSMLRPELASALLKEEERELWESMKVVSTVEKFEAIFHTVKMDNPKKGSLIPFQKCNRGTSLIPFVQCYLFPGQGSKNGRPHVFKMSTNGHGFGVDILCQVKVGGSLRVCRWALM